MRIRDTTADGINFHGGVTNSTVTNSDIRNTGDDGIAHLGRLRPRRRRQRHHLQQHRRSCQILANGIAIYGGHDNTVTGNLVVDSGLTQGGGIHVGQRFTSTPVGTTTISNNTLIRDGEPRPELAVRRRRAVVRRQPGRDHRADQRQQRADRAEPVRGGPVGRGHGQRRQPEQRDHRRHRHLRAAGADRRLGDVHQRHRHRRRAGQPGNAPSYSCEGNSFAVTDGGGNSGISPTHVPARQPDRRSSRPTRPAASPPARAR